MAIATPAASHFPLAMAALDAGKHVLVEKPLTVRARRTGRSSSRRPRTAGSSSCATTRTATPRRCRSCAGSCTAASSATSSSSTRCGSTSAWCSRTSTCSGTCAPHDLSILDYLLPPDVSRRSRSLLTAPTRSGPGWPASAYLTLRLSTGAMAHVHVNWLSPDQDPHDGHRRLATHRGVGRHEPEPAAVGLRPGRRPVGRPRSSAPTTGRRSRISYRTGDMVAPALPEQEALRR